jgi:hypothetical protein
MNVTDPWAQKWFDTKDGKSWLSANDFPIPPVYAPQRECTKNDPRPELVLSVNEGDIISQNILTVNGTANATADFRSWKLDFGFTDKPLTWTTLAQGNQPVNNDLLFNWNVSNLSGNVISLRLHVTGANGYAEKIVHFRVELPLPSPWPIVTPLPTNTLVPPLPTDTPTIVPTDTPTAFPTDTPTP